MASTPKTYGIASGTITVAGGFVGSVIESITITPKVTKKELTGNNAGQTVIDRRYTEKSEEGAFTAKFESGADPLALYGLAASLSIVSDDASAVTIGCTDGEVVACALTAHKGDWWEYSMTVAGTFTVS